MKIKISLITPIYHFYPSCLPIIIFDRSSNNHCFLNFFFSISNSIHVAWCFLCWSSCLAIYGHVLLVFLLRLASIRQQIVRCFLRKLFMENHPINTVHSDSNRRSLGFDKLFVWAVCSSSWNLVIALDSKRSFGELSLLCTSPEIFWLNVLDLVSTLQFLELESSNWVLAHWKCCTIIFGHCVHWIIWTWASNLLSILESLLIIISIIGLSKREYGLLLLGKFFVWLVWVLIVDYIVKRSTPDRILNALHWFMGSHGPASLFKQIKITI